MTISLRRATMEDVELLVAMRVEMRREKEYCELRITPEEFESNVRRFYRTTMQEGRSISVLAMDGDAAVACGCIVIQWVAPSYGNVTGLRGYISNVYTRAAWRRQGIGRRLLDALREIALEHGCQELHLNATPIGMKLYEEYGFRLLSNEMSMTL